MKRIVNLILINALVLAALLAGAEIVLGLLGVPTLQQLESLSTRKPTLCGRIARGEIGVRDDFFTGTDGIFRARPRPSGAEIVINREGFRGNEFDPATDGRPTLLLIGDSFVWGSTARPMSECFADRLQAAGFHVYNGGIPGTDVGQYARVAAAYVPRLKPRAVAVCLYEGNDLAPRPMPVMPGRNLQYSTDIGFIHGYDSSGRYFRDAREALVYLRAAVCGRCRTPWEWLHYRTRLGRALDRLIKGAGPYAGTKPDRRWIRSELLRIRGICRRAGSDFLVLIIPGIRRTTDYFVKKKYLDLLEGVPCYLPGGLGVDDYCRPPDNHFNNQGHRKFAEFARDVLMRRGHRPAG